MTIDAQYVVFVVIKKTTKSINVLNPKKFIVFNKADNFNYHTITD